MAGYFTTNSNWLCFDCRAAMRRPAGPVACPRCRKEMIPCGTRSRVPPGQDLRGWRRLRAWIMRNRFESAELRQVSLVRRRHQLERKIFAIESRPGNKNREKELQILRDKLRLCSY